MLEDGMLWLRTVTTFYLIGTLGALVGGGLLLRWLVQNKYIFAQSALRIIGFTGDFVGGFIGSVGILLLLIILWPAASDWIVNHYLAKTTIWQTEFQMMLTENLSDSRTATALGFLLKGVQFGSVALGYVIGRVSQKLICGMMGRAYHHRETIKEISSNIRKA